MLIQTLSDVISISDQITLDDLSTLNGMGVEVIVCNRPDGEAENEPNFTHVKDAASLMRISALHLPFVKEDMTLQDVDQLANLIQQGKRVHMYCRSGHRCSLLWALAEAKLGHKEAAIVKKVNSMGFKFSLKKLNALITERLIDDIIQAPMSAFGRQRMEHYDVVIVGGGSGGIAAAASLKKRDKELTIAIIDPGADLFYQSGWTMVGGGVFNAGVTKRQRRRYIPSGVAWLQHSVDSFQPDRGLVHLNNGKFVHYQQLVIAVGLELHWKGIDGLLPTLGKNGVTSNYRYDLAPYTWELVNNLDKGVAVFTQASMSIKCAGAPQKAMYLSAHNWLERGVLNEINLQFFSADESIFCIPRYVPALEKYLNKYRVKTRFTHTLVKVDGDKKWPILGLRTMMI